jgi:zinc finger FYVE domain-containing protein 26
VLQIEVVRTFGDNEGPPWKHSLFGNPNDADTSRRRCEVAEEMVERNFDLAFQLIYDFNLTAVPIYAGVAANLAKRKKLNQLMELLPKIKGTIDDYDWDQVQLFSLLLCALHIFTEIKN